MSYKNKSLPTGLNKDYSAMQVKTTWAKEKLNIGAALQFYRVARCLTFVEIQGAGGPVDSTLRALETNSKNNISIDMLLKLCCVLNVPIVEFIKKSRELSDPACLMKAGILDKQNYAINTKKLNSARLFCDHHRKLLKMSINQYSAFVQLSVQTYGSFSRGKCALSRNSLAKIAKAHQVQLVDLFSFH